MGGVSKGPRTNIFVGKFMSKANPLRLVLDRLSVHDSRLELANDRPMDGIALRKFQSTRANLARLISGSDSEPPVQLDGWWQV